MGEGESGQANGFTYLGPEEFEELVPDKTPEETRSTYLSALRRADQGDIGPLMEFLSG